VLPVPISVCVVDGSNSSRNSYVLPASSLNLEPSRYQIRAKQNSVITLSLQFSVGLLKKKKRFIYLYTYVYIYIFTHMYIYVTSKGSS